MNTYSGLESCLCCGSRDLRVYLDLGSQPLANSYHRIDESLERFPLAVQVCPTCFHSQLTVAVEPDLLYKNYLYVSGTSRTLTEYFREFVSKVERDFQRTNTSGQKSVLDIASNDGTLLKIFKENGWAVQGVDPAENLRKFAEANEVPTLTAYWDTSAARKLGKRYDVIVAQNVLAHIPNPAGFLEACKIVLSESGKIYIQTSQSEMFERNEFDTIYHEHHSFFSARSMAVLAERVGLSILEVYKAPVHGTSYVFVLGRGAEALTSIEDLIANEARGGRYNLGTYYDFAENALKVTEELATSVRRLRAEGMKVVGFGAAAKGMTLLNFGEIKLDYIVDDNPLKWNLFTPGMDIMIRDPGVLRHEQGAAAFVVLAWNFFEEIREKVISLRPGFNDQFIQYFPSLRITN